MDNGEHGTLVADCACAQIENCRLLVPNPQTCGILAEDCACAQIENCRLLVPKPYTLECRAGFRLEAFCRTVVSQNH